MDLTWSTDKNRGFIDEAADPQDQRWSAEDKAAAIDYTSKYWNIWF